MSNDDAARLAAEMRRIAEDLKHRNEQARIIAERLARQGK